MIKIEKTFGIKGVANDRTLVRLQEIIAESRKQWGWVGKAVIDPEKIMFYKFGLKLGFARHSTMGIIVDEFGILSYVGVIDPMICDRQVLKDVYALFERRCLF